MSGIKSILLVVVVILAMVGPVGAQGPGRPSWVKPGTRITYYALAASVPGSRTYLAPDPDGVWRNPQTGQRFSEKDMPGPAGHGFTEVTVAHIDNQVAVLDIRSLGMNPSNNNSRSVLTYSSVVGTPDNAEFWIHPVRLAAMRDAPAAGVRVYRMPYELNGRTFNVIRINTVARGASSAVYDLESGLLLFTTSTATGSPVLAPNAGGSAGLDAGSTVIAQSRLLVARDTAFPWNNTPLPGWFARVQTIDIQGRVITEVPYAGAVALPMAGRIELRGGGANWRSYLITTRITQTGGVPQMPNTLQRVSGRSSFGAIALNPQALISLAPGRMLDHDQATGMRAAVAFADHQLVVIAEDGHGLSIQYAYDRRTGMLTRVVVVTTLATGRETIEYLLGNPR